MYSQQWHNVKKQHWKKKKRLVGTELILVSSLDVKNVKVYCATY